MPPKADSSSVAPPAPLVLIWGDDDLAVKQQAAQVFAQWSREIGGMDHEIIDAAVANSGEALAALSRLREALLTFPLFGTGKVVWLKNCSFLGEERGAAAVTDLLASLADEFKRLDWRQVRLLISAAKVDRRKVFFKTIDKLGIVHAHAGISPDARDWSAQAEVLVRRQLKTLGKSMDAAALDGFVAGVGPNARLLAVEMEKLALFVGDRPNIAAADVEAVVSRNKQARAFALADAVGDRDLPRLLRTLDSELWEMKTNSQKSEIGLLYGVIAKIRALIYLKEMIGAKRLRPEADYSRFKEQVEQRGAAADERRGGPLSFNPYVLFKALPQVRRYDRAELVRAMERLLDCNRRLVSSGGDAARILQQTLVEIVRPSA